MKSELLRKINIALLVIIIVLSTIDLARTIEKNNKINKLINKVNNLIIYHQCK